MKKFLRYLYITFIIMAACGVRAATLSVRSFAPDYSNLSAATHARADMNDRLCALVIVELPVEGVKFLGNVVGDTPFYGSQYWVYLTDGTKRVQILCPGAESLMVDLADAETGAGVASKTTYILHLDGYETPSATPAKVLKERVTIEQLEAKYETVFDATEGLFPVKKDGKWGFVNEFGEEVVPLIFDYISHVREGMAGAMRDGKWGFIDLSDFSVYPLIYEEAGSYSRGLAAVKMGGKWGYVDRRGNVVIPCRYDEASEFVADRARVKMNETRMYFDKNGEALAPYREGVPAPKNASFVSYAENKYGYIDPEGHLVIPFIYDWGWHDFSEGLQAVKKDGKWGFIDADGNVVLPFKYDYADYFHDGKAEVKLKGKTGYIDRRGKFTAGRQK